MWRIGIVIERQRAYGRRLCEGIVRYARGREDWALEMLDWNDAASPAALSGCDGLIARVLDERMAAALRRTGRPVVDVYADPVRDAFASADQDADAIGRLAADHFTGRLFTRFAFFGHEGRRYSDLRRDAFRRALAEQGLTCTVYPTPERVMTRFNVDVMKLERYLPRGETRSIVAWIKKLAKPVAVFCSNDLRAYQLIAACRQEGIAVPSNVSVLGVDDDDLVCNFTHPQISSVNPNAEGIGFAAAAELDRLLSGGRRPRHLTVAPSGLVERLSSRAYAVEPAWVADALVFISRTLADGVSAADVYRQVGRSHTVVNAGFRNALGTTVQKTIAEFRLKEALRLVKAGKSSPAEIARLCGFASVEYFTNSFTARFGKPPMSFQAEAVIPPSRRETC